MAPQAAGSALIGPGPGEAQQLLPWEAASTAELFTHAGASAALRDGLAAFQAAVAYTRSADLARNLAAAIPRVAVHDPRPPAGAGHAAEWLARPLSSLGVPRDEGPPTLAAAREEHDEVAALRRDLPDRFLAVHPGSGSASKSWPADRFARMLDALGVDRFLLVEGPADAEAAGGLRTRKGAVDARGLAPRLLGAVLAQAAAYVGNDSGVTHLAAAWGAPTVALFGPTDPGVWSPVGPRVTIVRGPEPRMDGIAVEAVVAAVAPLLAERRTR
jgi:ADP-heptose:LPS heptosyltransferase